MEKNLITAGKLKELGLQVFGQKFDVNSDKSYTSVLTHDEECLVVDEILEGRNASGWFSFLSRYQKHYPLSSKALDLLLEKIGDNEKARELIANENKL